MLNTASITRWSTTATSPSKFEAVSDLGPATTYRLADIPKAHADIDANRVAGKLVGLTAEVNE